MSGDSVAFDRAAEYYDETRAVPEPHLRRTIELIHAEVSARDRVLEVGVGTGLLALPLHERGVRVTGIDLSDPMMRQLVKKAGGHAPFPIVRGDASRLPFPDAAFGAAYLRWVLHLIPSWTEVVSEIARVVRPGGRILINLGAYGGPRDAVLERFESLTERSARPAGLDFAGDDELQAEASRLGLIERSPHIFHAEIEEPLRGFLDGIRSNAYSWTWPVPPDVLARAADQLEPWVVERFGPLDRPVPFGYDVRWHVYEVPGEG